MEDFLISRNRNRLRCIDHPINVRLEHLSVSDRNDAMRPHAADMTASNAGVHRLDLTSCHQFCFFDRALDRLHGRFNINHHAFF